jgi:inner membrane protein
MKLPNHLIGGLCITGFTSTIIFQTNVLASPTHLTALIIGSMLPDIDQTKSIIGRIFYPLAKHLTNHYGHRTITHSAIFFLGLGLLIGGIEKTFFNSLTFTQILVSATVIHILLDSLTLQGIQFLYPVQITCNFFDKKEALIENKDVRAELLFFIAFSVLSIAQRDLWQNGFWTTYNANLGTVEALESEFKRSPDALHVTLSKKSGTITDTISGTLIQIPSESKVLLLNHNGFHTIENPFNISFLHSNKPLVNQNQSFINITADSLNKLLFKKHILFIDLQANNKFQFTETGAYPKQATSFKTELLFKAPVFAAIPDSIPLKEFIGDRSHLAQIERLTKQIQILESENKSKESENQRTQNQISDLRTKYDKETDILKKQELYRELKEVSTTRLLTLEHSRITELQLQINQIRQEHALKESTQKSEINAENKLLLSQRTETRFTGIFQYVNYD